MVSTHHALVLGESVLFRVVQGGLAMIFSNPIHPELPPISRIRTVKRGYPSRTESHAPVETGRLVPNDWWGVDTSERGWGEH